MASCGALSLNPQPPVSRPSWGHEYREVAAVFIRCAGQPTGSLIEMHVLMNNTLTQTRPLQQGEASRDRRRPMEMVQPPRLRAMQVGALQGGSRAGTGGGRGKAGD